jgi:hypothetical protein
MMSTCLLETRRGLKKTYYIKELCVKLVTYQKLYRDAQSAKYKTQYLVATDRKQRVQSCVFRPSVQIQYETRTHSPTLQYPVSNLI